MTTLDDMDAVYILEDMRRRNTEETGITTSIRVHLSAVVQTASGTAIVSRDIDLAPEEVLGVLRARTRMTA